MIPKKIHQIWGMWDNLPPNEELQGYSDSLKKLNPEYEYTLWNSRTIEIMIEKSYPEYYDFYMKLPTNVHRCDVARYFILHKEGGIYADMDIECLLPLDQFLDNHILLGRETLGDLKYVECALMFSEKGSDKWFKVIEQVKVNSTKHLNPLHSTGPMALTCIEKDLGVTVLHKQTFFPDKGEESCSWTIHHRKKSWLSPVKILLHGKKIP